MYQVLVLIYKTTIMKAIIISIAVAMSLSIGSSFGSNKLYRNVIANKEKNTITTTICKGQNDMNLVPLKKYVLQYNTNGTLKERVSYRWESYKKGWIPFHKYIYEYENENLMAISFVEWNKSEKSWGNDVQYVMNIYDSTTNLLSVINNVDL